MNEGEKDEEDGEWHGIKRRGSYKGLKRMM